MSLLLYLASLEDRAGKTAFGAALARRLIQEGRRVGYYKPIAVVQGNHEGAIEDPDTRFFQQTLRLSEPVSALRPLAMTVDEVAMTIATDSHSLVNRAQAGLRQLLTDRDVIIVEGLGGLAGNASMVQASATLAAALDAKMLLLVRPISRPEPETIVNAAKSLGERLLGVALNGVPSMSLRWAREELAPALTREGIPVYGIIPEERSLLAVTVEDMVQHLKAEVALCPDRLGALVENIMVGCLTLDSGDHYFRRRASKVVISRADRPDFQFAALDTPVHALFLTGNADTSFYILEKAQNLNVPVVRVRQDTLATIAALEPLLAEPSFYYPQKLDRMEQLIAQHVDLAAFYAALGLSPAPQRT